MRAGEHVCVLTWGRGSVLRAAGGAPRGRRVRQKGRRGDHQASSETAHRRYGGALRPATFLISFLRSLHKGDVCAQAGTVCGNEKNM